jgi:type IV pilus assembly protein PilA
MPRFSFAVLSALLTVSCGGGGTPPPNEVLLPPPSSASASPVSSSPPTASTQGRRSAPESILRYWAFDARPRLAAYADLGGLLRTDLGRAVVPATLSLAQGTITPEQAQCLRGAADSVKDLAVGVSDDGGLVIARLDDSSFDPGPCLTAAGAHAVQLEGAAQAFELHGTVVVHQPGLLLVGPTSNVKIALRPRSGESTFPHALTLGPDEYVAWAARFDEESRAHGTLLASSERFRIGVEADVPSFIAGQVEDQVRAVQGKTTVPGLDGEDGALAAKLLQSVQVKRDGSHLSGAFDLHEPPVDQARDLGIVASLAISGVRKYLVNAKSAEARNAVGQIAKDYAVWWEKEDIKPRGRRKLVSFPPVPKTIPRGVKYQSMPSDWKAWEPIRFEMEAPQYYQYEVRASKDGSSADIFARGDLDGDGKPSEFRLHLTVDRARDMLIIAPSLEEHDPDE